MKTSLFFNILSNLEMIAYYALPLVLVRIVDIIFGLTITVKDKNIAFDWRKLVIGIIYSILTFIGIVLLGTALVSLPEIFIHYEIDFIDIDKFDGILDLSTLLGLLTTAISTYGKDAYNKMLILLKGCKETEEK